MFRFRRNGNPTCFGQLVLCVFMLLGLISCVGIFGGALKLAIDAQVTIVPDATRQQEIRYIKGSSVFEICPVIRQFKCTEYSVPGPITGVQKLVEELQILVYSNESACKATLNLAYPVEGLRDNCA